MTKTKLEDYKDLSQPTEKELLQYILATQVIILRRLDFLERDIRKNPDAQSHENTVRDMIEKIPANIERMEEYLSQSDMDKGKIRF